MKTPIEKCQHLSIYTCTMLGHFPDNPTLTALKTGLEGSTNNYLAKNRAYQEAGIARIGPRVALKYRDHMTDRGLRAIQSAAEVADGKRGGKLSNMVMPDGLSPAIKPFGEAQVKQLDGVADRLGNMGNVWPDSPKHLATTVEMKKQYADCLKNRDDSVRGEATARAARDIAKEEFLDTYAMVAARIKAEYPRDRAMQELFFDKVDSDTGSAEPENEQAPADAPAT